jgi:hypothetical protein
MSKRQTTDQEKEVFQYLNELRESGSTNMFGARTYIISEFPLIEEKEAKELLLTWMKVFNKDGQYDEIEIK